MDSKLEQLFYFALGSALAVKDKLEKNSEELKAWQEKAEENAKDFFSDLAERGEKEKHSFKEMMTDVLKEVVADLDLATKADLEKLKKDLGH
ncbi:MAG: hypothetical protein JXQ81_08380 [Desulfuromonadales bacterium]|nr:hypothetical protein [Desulfuromonadales bacterium]MBN2792506.1 hypothetical protein [Desulfuromonadales bacterium]